MEDESLFSTARIEDGNSLQELDGRTARMKMEDETSLQELVHELIRELG